MRLRDWLKKFRKREPIIIQSEYGVTSESARLRAALNMKADPEIKRRVEEHLIKEKHGQEQGMAEARRRYPEAYQ